LPELLPENEKALVAYNLVSVQTRDLPDGRPKDIDLSVVFEVLKIHGWYNLNLFNKVVNLCRHMIGQRQNG